MKFDESNRLRKKSHALIPGGAHTYSKGDDQFPQLSPGFITRGTGCMVTDVDGNEFIDYGMGLRSVVLGHCHPVVNEAIIAELGRGNNFTRPSPLEIEIAELLVGIIPSAQMVKFAKNGSTVTTAAVKLARAATGRDLIARCAEHPFFSFDDWFIGSTAADAGVPRPIADLTVQFHFNSLPSVEKMFAEHPGKIACVMLEPAASEEPAPGFLQGLQALCKKNGAVFILDEMITGFRWHLGGAQSYYGVTPDLSTFGKAMGNGFSMSALVGSRELMSLGGLEHEGERVFLISTTHGAESMGLAATRATIDVFKSDNVVDHLWSIGRYLIDGFNSITREFGVDDCLRLDGVPCSPAMVCKDRTGRPSPVMRTLFMQELIQRGVLMPYIAVSLAHDRAIVDRTLEALRGAMPVLRDGLDGAADRLLVGPAVRPVFRKYNNR